MRAHLMIGTFVALLVGHPLAAAQCYTLYSPSNKVVYQSTEPLVDLSRPVSAQVEALHPGHHLVISDGNHCPEVDERGLATRIPIGRNNSNAMDSLAARTGAGLLPTPGPSASYLIPGAGTTPGTDIRVRAYTRSDGVRVRGHTRSRPSR
jgi:hypothetical protein